MPNTTITKRLEKKRNSPEVKKFKHEIDSFLNQTGASIEIAYKLKCDLSKKIDMPFYGEPKNRVYCTLTADEIAKEYIRLLIIFDQPDFTRKLITALRMQQQQTFRKIHRIPQKQIQRKALLKEGVFEHPVPSKYSTNLLISYINNRDLSSATDYIDFMHDKVPQVFLTKEQDNVVNLHFKDEMPLNWDWKKDSPFARYIAAGLDSDIYS